MSRGPGTPSRDLTRVVLCSSRMMSMQSSTHSSQMNTVGPAISFLTSCWLLPQKEQYSVFFESLPLDLVIATPSPGPAGIPMPGAEPVHPGTGRKLYVLLTDQQLVKSATPSTATLASARESARAGATAASGA